MKYFALLTILGENLLAQATALGTKLELTHMAVGDGGGSLPTPDTNQTKLIAEKRRAAINTLFIDDKNKNQIIAEQIIPEQDGGWWIREIGLFDKTGNLIAVANCPETYKPQLAEGSGRTQSIRMVLIVSHTESVTLKIDPSVVLATREYVNTEVTVIDKKIDALSAQTKLDLNKKFDKANISGALGNDNDKVPSLNLLATELGKKQPKGDYAPAGDYATKAELNKKFDSTNVVQSTGASTTQVMSQDAATKAFASKSLVKDIGYGQTALISPESKHQIVARDSGSSGLVNNTTGLHVWRFSENGTMTIGLIPVANGGTGAKTAPEARQNLSVYSKEESDLLAIPIGAGIEWDSPHIKPPSNFMAKEGQSFDKAANPELAKVYPDGKLPDRRGRFPRVLDNGKGLDVWSDRPIGSEQDDTLQKITGRLSIRSVSGVLNTVHDMEGAIFASDAFGGTRALPLENRSTGMQDSQFVNFDSGRVVRSSNETKPKNYAMQFYVRVR
ncbi:phage tail-collar fiber domain-containing protein [Providencia hangzhouensis]|uniref:phage tail-collar fiber domain-containing protein n=1 Tax=Providencia hangzhouensis TaxID=3031799 RepID=UPI003F49CF05